MNWFNFLMDYVTNQSHLDLLYDLPIWNKLITAGKDILDVLYKCDVYKLLNRSIDNILIQYEQYKCFYLVKT